MSKVFAYYRTSSNAGLGDDKDSEARQRLAVESYCQIANHEIVAEFYDKAIKGADSIDSRPEFARLLAEIAGNGVRTIVVETANRFARDLITQETGWRMLRAQGIDLIAADSPNAFLDDTPTANLIRQILGAVAQFEKAALVAKLTAARKRTGRMGGQTPLSVTAPGHIAKARQLHAEFPELTLRRISYELEFAGMVTSTGRPYNPAQIARMLETVK